MAQELFTADWFPYYFERFEASNRVALMSLAEEGAYHRAIRLAWKYGTVSSDPEVLAARLQKRCTPKMAAVVLAAFEPLPSDPSLARHPVVEQIRAEQIKKARSRSNAGKAGAAARWGQQDEDGENGKRIASAPPPHGGGNRRSRLETHSKSPEQDLNQEIDRHMLACVVEHPDIDPRLVKIAVIETLIRRTQSSRELEPIRSTRYFDHEIENLLSQVVELGLCEQTIDVVLKKRLLDLERLGEET